MYYDKTGKFIGLVEWAKLSEQRDYRRIGFDELGNGYRVSTVWLGLDHRFGSGSPLFFETMVFEDGSWSEVDCDRYGSEEDALIGHAAMVAKWTEKQRPIGK